MYTFFALIGVDFRFVALRASLLQAAKEESHRVTVVNDGHPLRNLYFRVCGEGHELTGNNASMMEVVLPKLIGSGFIFLGLHAALLQAAGENPRRIKILRDYFFQGISEVYFEVDGVEHHLIDEVKNGICCY